MCLGGAENLTFVPANVSLQRLPIDALQVSFAGSTLAANSAVLAAALPARHFQLVKALQPALPDTRIASWLLVSRDRIAIRRRGLQGHLQVSRTAQRRVELVLRQIDRLANRLADTHQAAGRRESPPGTARGPA